MNDDTMHILKIVAIGAGVGLLIYITGSSCFRLGKINGAGRMGDLVVNKFKIPMRDMPSIFEAAGVKIR